MASRILELCGFRPVLHDVVNGTLLSQGTFTAGVITECTALYMAILFACFVAAYPAALRSKLYGLALGIPVLHAGNILRIALVFAIGVKKPQLFEIAHVFLGQILMVLLVIVVCLAWVRETAANGRELPSLSGFVLRFFAFSAIPFLAWLGLNGAYVRLTDHFVRWLFWCFAVRLEIPYQHLVYYQTFNLVTFSGLVLASRAQVVGRKLWAVAAGFACIVGMHLLFRVGNVFATGFAMEAAVQLSNAVSIIGQYFLPIIFWIMIVSGKRDPGVTTHFPARPDTAP